MPKTAARALLTDFLKNRRARISPSDVGLPDECPRRRTRGLRRSEVALLARISTEWYTLFEMGRERAMTLRVIGPVARALRLNDVERDYLYDLVRAEEPPARVCPRLHPSIDFALRHVREASIIVYDPWLTRTHWNDVAAALFPPEVGNDWLQSNVLVRMFTLPQFRTLAENWEELNQWNLGLFRRALARDPLNPEAREILNALSGISDFNRLWSKQDVYSIERFSVDNVDAPFRLHHERYGELTMHMIVYEIPGWRGAHVRYVTPADETSADGFRAATKV